jgi:hypothetical protein
MVLRPPAVEPPPPHLTLLAASPDSWTSTVFVLALPGDSVIVQTFPAALPADASRNRPVRGCSRPIMAKLKETKTPPAGRQPGTISASTISSSINV